MCAANDEHPGGQGDRPQQPPGAFASAVFAGPPIVSARGSDRRPAFRAVESPAFCRHRPAARRCRDRRRSAGRSRLSIPRAARSGCGCLSFRSNEARGCVRPARNRVGHSARAKAELWAAVPAQDSSLAPPPARARVGSIASWRLRPQPLGFCIACLSSIAVVGQREVQRDGSRGGAAGDNRSADLPQRLANRCRCRLHRALAVVKPCSIPLPRRSRH